MEARYNKPLKEHLEETDLSNASMEQNFSNFFNESLLSIK